MSHQPMRQASLMHGQESAETKPLVVPVHELHGTGDWYLSHTFV
jgi:hypothetical protein